jgi:hypothetical protein
MGTLTISAAGFAALPAQPPPNWPDNLTWPAGGAVNGSKAYTISDADWVKLLGWAANANNAQLVANIAGNPATSPPPYVVTGVQCLLSLVQNWINGMISATTQHYTTEPQVPPPISIA